MFFMSLFNIYLFQNYICTRLRFIKKIFFAGSWNLELSIKTDKFIKTMGILTFGFKFHSNINSGHLMK